MKVFVRLPGPAPETLRQAASAAGWTLLAPDHTPSDWQQVRTPGDVVPGRPSWICGSEIGGPVGDATALTLIRAVAPGTDPWVVEGVGPAAAAAALAVGATGVVIGPATWLCTGITGIPDAVRPGLQQATTGRDTAVRGELADTRERVLTRGLAPFPAPQSVAQAARFAGRVPAQAIRAVLADIADRRATVTAHHPLRVGCDPLNTGRPIVQGPMANVTEAPALGAAVQRAGGLPFAALGALDPDQADAVLSAWATQGGPWGVGVIGFDVMPHRDAHLDAIVALADRGPQAVILAGGSPALAARLQALGLTPWLHTPSARLVTQALRQGVDAVVLEGHEAGGHVGALTSAGLWEEGLRAVEDHVDAGGAPPLVVLAGGIGDPVSAAFAAALAAPAAQRGVRVALQAGTAFLFTHEIVEAGQITALYQSVGLAARRTVLVGSSVNLGLRVPDGPAANAARALEQRLLREEIDRAERRLRLEHHNLGRTRLAARGIERAEPAEGRRYRPVSSDRQRAEGAFTMGQGAAVTHRIARVDEVVAALSTDAAALLDGAAGRLSPWGAATAVAGEPTARAHIAPAPVARAAVNADIAVVGLGCIVPGAGDALALWRHLLEGHDAIRGVDEDRWGLAAYHDATATHEGPVRTYARHAARVDDPGFDPLRFRIPPSVLPTVDASQRLALLASAEAIARAGWDEPGRIDPRRAAVILGNSMGGEHAKDLSVRVRFREVLAALRADPIAEGWTVDEHQQLEDRIEAVLDGRLAPIAIDSMAGLLSNVVAGRVASWLDWMGGNLTVDAACAASLAAVSVAVDWLRAGRCDAVLTGGIDTDMSPETYIGFSRTRALSATGSHPFSDHGDGFVMGEGAAVFALKRLDDALRDGDPVWAVIRGVGQACDGRGRSLTAPRPEGQALAIQRAWAEAGLHPSQADVIEAHGTGTTVGDRTEAGVWLRARRDADRPAWLGSIKSGLGHLKGAAGAAGLAKTVMALQAGVLPPTLRAGPLHPDLAGNDALSLPRAPVTLPQHAHAGVSAFGFGGTDFHVVLASPPTAAAVPAERDAMTAVAAPLLQATEAARWRADDRTPLVLLFTADSAEALQQRVRDDLPVAPDAAGTHRLAVVAPLADRARVLQRAATWLDDPDSAPLPPGVHAAQGPAQPVSLLFPGQGAQRPGAVAALQQLPAGARALHAAGGADALAARESGALQGDPVDVHAVLFGVGVTWAAVLAEAGVPLAATAGHSLGAFAAQVAAGMCTADHVLPAVMARGAALDACPPGAMLAVRVDPQTAQRIAEDHGLALAAINTPTDCVLCGPAAAVDAAAASLGTDARPLQVARAYHSPAVAPAAEALRAALAAVPFAAGDVPVVSTATAQPIGDPAGDLVDSLTAPVRFHDAIRALRRDHPGPVIEVGPGATLSRLAGAGAIPLDPVPGDRGAGIVSAAAALWAHGHPGLLALVPGTLVQVAVPPPRTEARRPAAALPAAPRAPRMPADASDLHAAVREVICEVTGYPAEFIDDDADLEGDLGVDSIRKLEILGLLEQRLGFSTPESQVAALADADLAALVAHARARLDAGDEAPTAAAEPPAVFTVPVGRAVVLGPAEAEADWVAPTEGDPAEVLAAALGAAPQRVAVAADTPLGQGVAGWLRSWAREGDAAVHLVHVTPGAAPTTVARALAHPDHGELRVGPRGTLALRTAVLDPAPDEPSMPPDAMWLVSGGLGIAAACLPGLAASACVLGRRPRAEVATAVDALTATGVAVHYVQCDVTDPVQVRAAAQAARDRFGRIDAVLHAAAVLRDAPAAQQDAADRRAVWGPKVDGARHLAAATAADAPALWCVFSSLVAHLGNPGQTAYAAANAAAETIPHPTAARSLAIAWTAWRDVGMAADPALQRLLASRGIRPLCPRAGGLAFARLVRSAWSGPVRVAAQTLPDTDPAPWPLGAIVGPGRFSVPLSADDPALADHRVGGRPLVPAALWVAAMVAAARCQDPLSAAWSVEALHIETPTFVAGSRADITVSLQPAQGGWTAIVEAGGAAVCTAQLQPCAPPQAQAAPAPLAASEPAAALYRPDLLFHGPTWRVLDRVHTDGNGGAAADLVSAGGPSPLAEGIDAAHQLLCAWGAEANGWLGLPVGAARWVWAPGGAPHRLQTHAAADDDAIEASVTVLDAAGAVVLQGDRVRLQAARRG